jgi:hypothetical protein
MARTFRLWEAAKSPSEGHKHLVRIWELCEPEIKLALNDMAAKARSDRQSWLRRRDLSFQEISYLVYPAVKYAAHRYDPEHESGASFSTFALQYIKGEVDSIAKNSPPLVGYEQPTEELEKRPQDELRLEEEPLDFAARVALVHKHPVSEIVEKVYQTTKYPEEHSSGELRRVADQIEENFSDELKQDPKLQALHSMLIAQSIRAEDHEGRMLLVSRLAHLLVIRQYRKKKGMHRERYSPKVLAKEYGRPSDKTLAKWLKACDEQGITAQNWTPEQLVKIISSRRGPKFRGRLELPTSRPDE